MRARATALLATGLWIAAEVPLRAEELVVIVHPSRAARLDTDTLAQIYLKQRRRWPDGEVIVPVNRESTSDARAQFARSVLSYTPRQLAVYWNRQYFHGTQPPATLASDEAMKRFVANEPRAIGYIHASVLDASVRSALRLPEPSPPPDR